MNQLYQSVRTFAEKQLFPRDDEWGKRQKMDNMLFVAAVGLGLITALSLYGFVVAHLFMNTGGKF